MPFHNPYHFVPVQADESAHDMAASDFKSGVVGHVTHDRYVRETLDPRQPVYAGRLLCRVVAEGPIVIGDQREALADGSHRVIPFQLDDQPALPASTLRGLISSVAEAASNSALRVLEDRSLSYRVGMQEGLSAIGMIVKDDPCGPYRLRPLALPTMPCVAGSPVELDKSYHLMFPLTLPPPLKLYVGDAGQIRDLNFVGQLPLQTFTWDEPQYCYAKLYDRKWNIDHSFSEDNFQYRKGSQNKRDAYLLSQKTTDNQVPVLAHELPSDDAARAEYTRGILRVLGVPGREDDMPNTKKHELFIPYPEGIETRDTFPILPEAIETFYRLADERTEASRDGVMLPFEPRGTQRNTCGNEQDYRFRLKTGDLVYFRPNDRGDAVAEISLSAIWRRHARGTSHTYFRHLSKEKLPFNPDRDCVSMAEQLFGFVEQPGAEREDRDAYALASRLRFSFGHLANGQQTEWMDETTLKILASPKPPSPALYFKRRGAQRRAIVKKDLNPNSHVPQGRKFYLHRSKVTPQQWETQVDKGEDNNLKQKSRVTPLGSGAVFYFHIDFDNLSQQELGLLCYASRPAPEFRHKLGMGKPLGLGQVRIDPVGLFYIDRQQRYQESSLFEARRYHGCWLSEDLQTEAWPGRYRVEIDMSQNVQDHVQDDRFPAFDALRDRHQQVMATRYADILRALELLGNPANVRRQVHYPQVDGVHGAEMEAESFRWFVANDVGSGSVRNEDKIDPQHEPLAPLMADTERLPTLSYHPWRG